jgi:hypothetical protein
MSKKLHPQTVHRIKKMGADNVDPKVIARAMQVSAPAVRKILKN